MLIHLAIVLIQAACLAWLYRDCGKNSALTGMTIFYVPLTLSVLNLIGMVGYLILCRNKWTARGARISLLLGIVTTLCVIGACGSEGHI